MCDEFYDGTYFVSLFSFFFFLLLNDDLWYGEVFRTFWGSVSLGSVGMEEYTELID